MKIVIKKTKKMGRGVFANKDFKKDEVIEKSPCIILNYRDIDLLNSSDLEYYTFAGPSNSLIALGCGSLFNHSKRPCVTYRYDAENNLMIFTALRYIKKGSQLFINYGYDPVHEKNKREMMKNDKYGPSIVESGEIYGR